MKFTLNWLKDFLDTSASLREVVDTLTAIGLEVESVTDLSKSLQPFIVARITKAAPHPDASKLQVCTVFDGEREHQIVCGAANARANLNIVLAREGVTIPANGMVIKKTKIRGVESNGMICSAEELGQEESSEGILELPESAVAGAPAAPLLGADDPVIEIAITPNRGDCLGVYGIARDLAAAGLGTLNHPAACSGIFPSPACGGGSGWGFPSSTQHPEEDGHPPPNLPPQAGGGVKYGASPINVTIQTPACSRFTGCTIRGVKNGDSPAWLKQRLAAIGQRSISALVDISNYIMLTYNRPLHVYDAAKLDGNITVRSAKEGEMLLALNGEEYTLASGMVVIADDKKPLGLGGIIGGEATGCTEETTDVFLESALFDPIVTATTGRTLDVLSDARYRFERSVDPAFVDRGAELALAMIQELCGGEASEWTSAGGKSPAAINIDFNPAKVNKLGGVEVATQEITTILTALGFSSVLQGEKLSVTVPTWRSDVTLEADLIEEILRIKGYDLIPTTSLPAADMYHAAITPGQKRLWTARRVLAARGMVETCNWSFIAKVDAERFGGADASLTLLNPISADLDTMRPNLYPHLLTAVRNNQYRGVADMALFEGGLQFSGTAPDGQHNVVTGLRAGQLFENNYQATGFSHTPRDVDAWDAKADVFAALTAIGVNTDQLKLTADVPVWYHPGRAAALTLGGKIILGYAGELHPSITRAYDIKGRAAGFELLLDNIPLPRVKTKAKKPLQRSEYQAVERDFAFIVGRDVQADALIRAVAVADKKLVQQVEIFDVYSGKGVDEGKKSVALKVLLQAPDRTLSDTEIHAASEAVIAAVNKSVGGMLRQ